MINRELFEILRNMSKSPDLEAVISGEGISGEAQFWGTKMGVICLFNVHGLPKQKFLGLHIHEFGACTPTMPPNRFSGAGPHFNPSDKPHPEHLGDLPPLYTNDGHALSAVLINKFTISQIKGKSVVIHSAADDFTTQPAGNSGERIACGVIRGR